MLKKFQDEFNPVLQQFLNEKINSSKKIINYPKYDKFFDYINNFFFSGGKRIRPFVFVMSYLGLGGQEREEILKFSIIFELLHTMAIIHDDRIDNAQTRHKVNTVHQQYQSFLNNKHIGDSQAILIGDLLLAWFYEKLNQKHNFDTKQLEKCKQNIFKMVDEVILGQIIDVDMMLCKNSNYKDILNKTILKTAKYTFSRPMMAGAILTNTDKKTQNIIFEIGEYLGLAYQIRDDLKDITQEHQDKSVFNDIQEGQQTFFTNFIYQNGSQDDIKYLNQCLKKELNNKQIKKLSNIFEKLGAIKHGKNLIEKNLNQATKKINQIPYFDKQIKETFFDLIKLLSK